jgi:predicted DNA-binding transcriptional regulator AlpA
MGESQQDNKDLLGNLLTRIETAKILGVTPRSLDRWAWQREGPTRFKIGRLTYYDRSDINAWLEKLKADTGRGGSGNEQD